ncbi:hypothetical protein QCA50_014480 [Cerrena zonata]|uniref:Alpha/beta hydrolase fold-3 domain-containing protein n=1 Tax=Cerrena zonata TaxID=2478898 RepID=A0AAW0FSK0_9APHY
MSMSDKFPKLDPEIAALLSMMPAPASTTPNVERARKEFGDAIAAVQENTKAQLPLESEYRLEDRSIPVENGEISVRCLFPTPSGNSSKGPYPLLVWYHGGGYYLGSVNLDDYLLRKICVKYGLVIVNVEYRMAPEFPYPTSIHDGYATLKWAVENHTSLNASPTLGLMVGGGSSGGNLAASVALRARDDPLLAATPLTGQMLVIPWLLHSKATVPEKYKAELKSMEENADGPLLTSKELDYCLDMLKVPDPNDPLFSLILAPSHKNLPPAYFVVAGHDPLRDEGLLYEKILKQAGVRTKLDF